MPSLIRPLQLGCLTLPNNLIQGPLAGISCAPFRLLTHRLGSPAFSCTEMISSKNLARGVQTQQRYLYRHPDEGIVSYQISGDVPADIFEATRVVVASGADLVDLNCGCPMTKIRKKGAGSALLSQPETLVQCIQAMRRAAGGVPVSIKIRVDGNSADQNNRVVSRIAQEEGVDFIVVHGRHWTERYDIACHDEQIAQIVDQLSIPVIGNGDVCDVASLKRLFATGCAGVMIARAGVGQPWLYQQLQQALAGQIFIKPTWQEIGHYFIEHVTGLVALEGEIKGVLQARKLGKYYGRALPGLTDFLAALHVCITLDQVNTVIRQFF